MTVLEDRKGKLKPRVPGPHAHKLGEGPVTRGVNIWMQGRLINIDGTRNKRSHCLQKRTAKHTSAGRRGPINTSRAYYEKHNYATGLEWAPPSASNFGGKCINRPTGHRRDIARARWITNEINNCRRSWFTHTGSTQNLLPPAREWAGLAGPF